MPVSFEQLYSEDKRVSLGVFLIWVNDLYQGFGVEDGSLSLDLSKAHSFVSNLTMEGFPAVNGYNACSPFKRAAHMYVYLHATDPFEGVPLPTVLPQNWARFPKAMATVTGYNLVKACLTNVQIDRSTGGPVTLANPIKVSRHFLDDLIEASSEAASPAGHFKHFSLLFESLAYCANPDASYPRVL